MPLPALAALPALLEIGKGLIDRFFPDPDKAAAAKLELLKMQETGELARLANDTKLIEAILADTQSARDREVKIATSAEAPLLNKIIVPCLAIGVLVSSFALFGVLLLDDGTIEASRKDVFIYILGVLSAIDTQIIAYYFGSSAGSTAKDQTIKRALGNG
jgi:hypothetical protein